jgi:hypothetical protein
MWQFRVRPSAGHRPGAGPAAETQLAELRELAGQAEDPESLLLTAVTAGPGPGL